MFFQPLTRYRVIKWVIYPSEGAAGARSAIEVLACRNDLNCKRIVSLQLTANG